ncbi:MAG: uncharacterized protein PWR02_1578 [Synergistales bacterium]|jgi:uncharacterized protein with PIN domain|nr:uncharacterized protein [Synergistales bacterium]
METMSVRLEFHGDLVALLKRNENKPETARLLFRTACAKDLIESQGVPHTEVGYITTGEGCECSFMYIPRFGETLHVWAHTPPVDVTRATLLFPNPLEDVSFIVDVNVGRLAKLLRLAGFDTLYHPDWDDDRIAEIAEGEGRIVLTRDRELLKRNAVTWGRLVRISDPWDQFGEIVSFFGLEERIELFSRCPTCNGILEAVEKEEIIDRLEPLTRLMYNTFTRCPRCGQIYWRGSHHSHIREKLAASLKKSIFDPKG